MPRKNFKNSPIKEERDIYKKHRKAYLKRKQQSARITKNNGSAITQYQAKIKTAKREIKLYERAIDVLLKIQKVTKGK